MDWSTLKEGLEIGYYFCGILLSLSIIIGVKQLKLLKKDMVDKNRRASVEKSIEVLAYFARKFIPAYDEYLRKFRAEIPKRKDTSYLINGEFNISIENLDKESRIEVIVQQDSGLIQLFNELEFFSLGILEGLAVDKLVYTPIAKEYCKMIEREHLLLSALRNKGAPYKNVVGLYMKWKDHLELEQMELQKTQLEHKINMNGDNHKDIPPIGTSL